MINHKTELVIAQTLNNVKTKQILNKQFHRLRTSNLIMIFVEIIHLVHKVIQIQIK